MGDFGCVAKVIYSRSAGTLDRQAIWEGKPQSLFFIQYLAIANIL